MKEYEIKVKTLHPDIWEDWEKSGVEDEEGEDEVENVKD